MSAADTWTITNRRFDARTLAQHNSVFTVSNGYLGLTGHLQQDHDGGDPLTILNGIYDEVDMFGLLRPSKRDRPYLDPDHFAGAGRSPAVANLPSPLSFRAYVDGRELSATPGSVSNFSQCLDLSCGLYSYGYDLADDKGRRTRIDVQRFASLAHPHRAYMRATVTPLDYAGRISVLSGIDGSVRSRITGERQFHVRRTLAVVRRDDLQTGLCFLIAETLRRKHAVRLCLSRVCHTEARLLNTCGELHHDGTYVRDEFVADAGQPITIERCIVLASSEDQRHGVAVRARDEIDRARAAGFTDALVEQEQAWASLWRRADVQIEGDAAAQRYMRFCLHHLLAAAPRHTHKLSVPVKLLSGDYYQGNTFYDTDLYIVPFYTFTLPDVARNCLNWRHIGLDPARQTARKLGYRGAKFAWQAGPFGEECLGDWYRFTRTNVHINSDVAYALMQYYRATGDRDFMCRVGIDLLVETARFLASRVTHDAERGAYNLEDATGPDEGHCRCADNFYTNFLAARNLCWAAETLEDLRRRAPEAHADAVTRLEINADEPRRWLRIAAGLTLLYDPDTRLYEQYRGFYELDPAPADLLDSRTDWFEEVYPFQALNQPDVLMAMALFREAFDESTRRANWDYYKDKSLNFSSMSFVVNAIGAADLGELDRAYRDFIISSGMDLDESLTGRGDTHQGLHGTAAGGAWMAAVFGFGGVCLTETDLHISPRLPPQWQALRFNLAYRGRLLSVCIDEREITVTHCEAAVTADVPQSGELKLIVAGQPIALAAGESCRVCYQPGAGAD